MRRIFALLAVASLSGCITDGPNRTGSAWLDEMDLGPQGYETVTLPVSYLAVDSVLEPGVAPGNGVGSLVVGRAPSFDFQPSFWVDPRDTTRWISGGKKGIVDTGWTFRLVLDTTCPSSGTVKLSRWKGADLDTATFLLGRAVSAASVLEVSGRCHEDASVAGGHYLDFDMGDTGVVVRKGESFGLRLASEDFPARRIARAVLLDHEGDSLYYGLYNGRGAWASPPRWMRTGSIAGSAIVGSRVRMRLDGDALRGALIKSLGMDPVESDSFDNTFAVFSARAISPLASVSSQVSQRFRLASWSVLRRDTTELAYSAGASAVRSFSSGRSADGKSMSGQIRVTGLQGGYAKVELLTDDGSDADLLYTSQGDTVRYFYLDPGQKVDATSYYTQSWMRYRFENLGGSVRYVRTVVADALAADDQIQSLDENADPVYRQEAIAVPGASRVRFEARTAFARAINLKSRELWTDLYSLATDADATLEGNFKIELGSRPVDSVTFIVRRRNQGVVE